MSATAQKKSNAAGVTGSRGFSKHTLTAKRVTDNCAHGAVGGAAARDAGTDLVSTVPDPLGCERVSASQVTDTFGSAA